MVRVPPEATTNSSPACLRYTFLLPTLADQM
jgi:hypothetical protein